jgi:8-oxo-dGTP pyrophosphatase MutT (NUDIX family)
MSATSDFRKETLDLLKRYTPSSDEVLVKEQMLAFIANNPSCFERSLEIGHITASAWLLNKDGTQALLMHHKKLNKWVQLGGHCDGDPHVLHVAIKEAQEESGILQIKPVSLEIFDLDIHEIPKRENIPAHLHYDIRFLLQVTSDETLKKNHESKALLWIDKDPNKLPTQSRSVTRMFAKWLLKT